MTDIHKTTRTRAQCDDCPGLAPDAARQVARAHADFQGHEVRFVVEETVTYVGIERVDAEAQDTVEQRFARAIREARLERGWSQQMLSDELRKIGIEQHQTSFSRIEKGTQGIGLDKAFAIAELLGIDLKGLAR